MYGKGDGQILLGGIFVKKGGYAKNLPDAPFSPFWVAFFQGGSSRLSVGGGPPYSIFCQNFRSENIRQTEFESFCKVSTNTH